MADSWWEDLLVRMFGSGVDTVGVGGGGFEGAKALSGSVQTELKKEEQAGNPQPTPTAKPAPTAQQPNPNARDDEALASGVRSAADGIKANDPLYGNLPDAMVYLGSERVMHGQNLTNIKKSVVKPIAEVTAQINEWSPKKLEKFAVLAVAAGYLKTPTNNVDELETIWQALAIRSAKMYSRGVKATPWELLERYGTDPLGNKVAGPVTTTSVSKNVNLSSPRDANTLVDAALSDRLGRAATKEEKKAFLAALNKAEKKEPNISKTTTTVSGSGTENVSQTSNTETSGGVNATSFAQEYALGHNKDEAGQHQALSTYMPAFFAALGAPV